MATIVSHTWQELINHSELITNYYLYGQATKPIASELLSDKWIRQQGIVDITIKISNFDSYMNDGPGRYANASQINVVSGFFESSLPNLQIGEKATYTLSEAISKFGQNGTKDFAQTDFNGGLDGTYGNDYAARVYEFQTQKYLLNQHVTFVIERNADGQYVRRIENFALLPVQDDFDFNSSSFFTNFGNSLIEDDIDPSSIGRRVVIPYSTSDDFGKGLYSTQTYTSASYAQDQIRFTREDHGTYLDAYQPIKDLVANLWSNGTTKFIDPLGRAILYGTTTSNQLSADAHSAFAYDSYMQEYYWANLQKGIAIVAGGGGDTLSGGAYKDYLLGGSGTDTLKGGAGNDILLGGTDNDTLQGGSGNDTYIFNLGDGRDTIADNSGTDTIKFSDGIGIDDLVFFTSINDLTIGVKEEGKSIWELHDLVTITDWRHSSVKKFNLQGSGLGIDGTDGDLFFSKSGIQDGELIGYDFTDLFGQRLSSDDSDILYLSDANEYVMGQGGEEISIHTHEINNNKYKLKTFACNAKIDTMNNYFYIRKAA